MKLALYLGLLFLILPFILSNVSAQSMTGPGLTDRPPSAGPVIYNDNDLTRGAIRDTPTRQKEEEPSYEEKGPKGERAQKAVGSGQYDLSKKEIKRKQKGE